MADKELINTSIDEYLISLANSINHAQRYISQLRVAGQDGQPSVTYQLPRVEFELKLLFQLDTRPPPSGVSNATSPRLKAAPSWRPGPLASRREKWIARPRRRPAPSRGPS